MNYASCLAESLAAGRVEARSARIALRGDGELSTITSGARGAVVVTAHVGAWDVAARLLGRDTQRDVTTVMAREGEGTAGALHDAVRADAGVRVHHVGDEPLDALALLRTLRTGGIIAIQLDRCPPGTRAIQVPFFGQSVDIPLGPFVLAALAGVPVLPIFVAREGFFSYSGTAAAQIRLARKPAESELRDAVRQATSAMEAFIRRHPTQWFHFSDV